MVASRPPMASPISNFSSAATVAPVAVNSITSPLSAKAQKKLKKQQELQQQELQQQDMGVSGSESSLPLLRDVVSTQSLLSSASLSVLHPADGIGSAIGDGQPESSFISVSLTSPTGASGDTMPSTIPVQQMARAPTSVPRLPLPPAISAVRIFLIFCLVFQHFFILLFRRFVLFF